MKKLFLLAIYTLASIAVAGAQEISDSLATVGVADATETTSKTTDSSVWKHSKKSFSLGWVSQDFAPENGSVYNSKYGGMLKFDRTFFLHRKPVAGIMKFGLDLVLSTNVAKLDVDGSGNRTSNWDSLEDDSYYYYDDDDDDDESSYNIGMWTLTGSIGVGPSLTVAPFAKCNGGIKYLKAKIYGHYMPSYTTQFYLEGDESEAKSGFCNMFEFGGKIMYKVIGVGIDGNWGSGKFKSLISDSSSDAKIKHKIANTRIYLSLNF